MSNKNFLNMQFIADVGGPGAFSKLWTDETETFYVRLDDNRSSDAPLTNRSFIMDENEIRYDASNVMWTNLTGIPVSHATVIYAYFDEHIVSIHHFDRTYVSQQSSFTLNWSRGGIFSISSWRWTTNPTIFGLEITEEKILEVQNSLVSIYRGLSDNSVRVAQWQRQ